MKATTSPLRIGYCLSLTGPVADNARSARLAHEIWQENVNRSGGLLNRKVELICRDDFSNAANVPNLYRQLLDEDKVDLVIGGYGTNSVAPALPVVAERELFFVGLQGLGANDDLSYPGYFAIIPTGPDPNPTLTEGFFALAAQQSPRPTTVALLSADALFAKNPIIGARVNAEKYGFEIVHEATYALATENFTEIVEEVAKSNCDLLFICSYLNDSIGLVRAIHASSFRPKMVGASMIGPQTAAVKSTLGPLLNGFVNYEYWAPVGSMMFPGTAEFLTAYQARAAKEHVDLLGHYTPLLAYAQMQVVAQAVEATGGIYDAELSAYAREATFNTVMGPIRFGKNGEWAEPRVLQVQFQGIDGHGLQQFRQGLRQIVVWPPENSSGTLKYPYIKALTP
ncbi:branched-chain amino acid ABC transporter substrate-binding protein [Massilia sp. KIM]|uniref:amino acid ABC transporter substrate-binding protein n=1 Tax=Massilia sp. KIM TaxID=1955422 RepID=UPI00098F783E|nr:amino acid ABC transporter substrate-binding protein [Massilia sp. KIM]OON62511.1 branched-chain amino acid ABC transporter substrate-binding protein [Massilia sp. KIM]